MGVPVINLGQDYDIPRYRRLLRQACRNWEYYQGLAQEDPDFQDAADWYGSLCADAQAALTRAIQRIAEQETPGALQGARYGLSPGLGTRVFGDLR